MKGLIIIKEERCRWLRELVPVYHPAMITLCNKPLLEYLLEFAILCGADKVRFVFDSPDDRIEDYFDTGSRWGIDISYSSTRENDQLEDILKKNSSFRGEDPLLILDGFFFIRFDKGGDYGALFLPGGGGAELCCEGGEIRFQGESGPPAIIKGGGLDLSIHPIMEIGDIFSHSMDILSRDAHRYILPGYNNEEGVYIGRNVTLPKSVKITRPILLGNNVQLGKNCEIGPGAVIGNNVIVDGGSRIENSIILDNTYIGGDLTIKEKIVHSNMAISVETGNAFKFVDQHLLSGISNATGCHPLKILLHWCMALFFYVVGVVPATVMQFLLKNGGNWQEEEKSILLADGTPFTVKICRIRRASLGARIASGLALDKVVLLPGVLSGKLDLVGNKPIVATSEGKIFFDDFAGYLPGVFSFSEAENIVEGNFQEEITERFFTANRSLVMDIKVIFKTLINRWQLQEKDYADT
ncbi:NDP-sugar synthase [Desulforhopalus vacuolatus]|uniref:NDP-sugar synthase n=1 Tax=Desulforhopalus vacuolatus TaxID=40414 RepID=UPI00196672CC|nr:NDP-sugar synthase [Desulforhopalus vacuolatus]MBM9520174.1 NDP-sugar synthase [Desulforhopalus vacuolatus]